ncbi:MAG: hypothetical protein WBE34_17375 [Candidatus Nitrosopolaris sp.]
MLKGGVDFDLVIRLERKKDVHTISNKTFDFSTDTIRQLLRDGYEETREQVRAIQITWNELGLGYL